MLLFLRPLLRGQESCSCTSDIGAASTATYLSTLSLSNPLSNSCKRISGVLIVDQDFTINNGYLQMMPGSAIIVSAGITLTLNNINSSGGIHACDTMWRGITLQNGSRLVMDNCHLRDAQYGIRCDGKQCFLKLTDNYFDRNYVSIYVPPPAGTPLTKIITSVEISGNTFTCDNNLKKPYTGQSPAPGIIGFAAVLLNNASFVLGSNSQNYVNEIHLLENGVVAHRSQVAIYHTKISSLTPLSVLSKELMYDVSTPDGIGIFVDSGSHLTAYHNQMEQVRRGIHGFHAAVFADGNTIEECVHGIVSLSAEGATIAIADTISFQMSGVYIRDVNNCNQIQVTRNELEGYVVGAFANNLGSGIRISNIPGTCVVPPEVSSNHLSISNKFNGIGFGLVYQNATIDNNTVVFDSNNPIFTLPPCGIALGKNSFTQIVHNTIDVLDAQIYDGYGIDVGTTTDAIICDNTVNWMSKGISFYLNCNNDTVRLNHLGNHDNGLYYYDGTMTGIQDNQGNEWNGTGGATSTFTTFPLVALSRYFVEDCPNQPLWPPTFSPSQSACSNNSSDWFWSQSGTIPNDCSIGPSHNVLTGNDIPTATGALDTLSAAEGLAWEAKRHLFRKLTDYPDLLEENEDVADFYEDYEASNLSQFNAIDLALQAIYTPANSYWTHFDTRTGQIKTALEHISTLDSLYALASTSPEFEDIEAERASWMDSIDMAYLTLCDSMDAHETVRLAQVDDIQDLNDGIEPDNTLEENEHVVNTVYLETVVRNILSLDSAQVAQLFAVAEQCPLTGGAAVWRARWLVRLADTTEFSNESFCEERRPQTLSNKGLTSRGIRMLPNPATGRIQVLFDGGLKNDNPIIQIRNISGNLLLEKQVPSLSDSTTVDTSVLLPGLYYCILSGTGKQYVQKLTIIR